MTPTSAGWFRLSNRDATTVLDVTGCATAAGTKVQLCTWQNNNCQQFRLQPVGALATVNNNIGRVLDVANCASANGTDVCQWLCGNAAARSGALPTQTTAGSGSRRPQRRRAGLIVAGESISDGANVEQGACSGNQSQPRLEPLPDGGIRLVPRGSGKALDVASWGLGDGPTFVIGPGSTTSAKGFAWFPA